ncbi:pseudaminic acid synthase [uncultured Clostridium sp.]|uniref:pseudaminic acid synthase n=1 Tax=uncultured Clostridium sp. TaxID=59620 RepID=UPI0025E3CDD9|nr:pseudaminic acid synthase [uncultured Clostridium sp.]
MIDINGFEINKGRTFIIAEMSANHLQNFNKAMQIIEAAADAGADAIKLQTYRPDTITMDCKGKEFMATPGSPWEGMNLYELYEKAYTPWEWHKELMDHARQKGLICFSAPFDLSAVDFLEELKVPAYKIASYEIEDIPLIKKVASTGKPIILSTGIATIEDINCAIETCIKTGNRNIILLKCLSAYPAPYNEMNLKTIPNMKETFGVEVGVSDHTLGDEVAIASVAIGATVIEKHLTLSRKDGGPDSSFSMEPKEFKHMVNSIRNIEKAMGKVSYQLTEKQILSKERGRSLYVVEDIKEGEFFTDKNIKSIRPGFGIKPKYYEKILGKYAKCNIKRGTALKWSMIGEV